MRKLFATALLILCTAAAAQAQDLVYEHEGDPLFMIDFPDGWNVDLDFAAEAKEAGTYVEGEPLQIRIVEANPSDGSPIWVGFWAIPDVSTLDEAVEYLSSLNADLFGDLEISDPKEIDLNGMLALTATGSGIHEGEAVEFIAALFQPQPGTVAAGLYVGAVDAWKDWEAELREMVASLAPAS